MRNTLHERLLTKFTKSEGCWEWTAAKSRDGYGVIGRGGRGEGNVLAHRALYELMVGPIPAGLTLDHLCRNRACVRPDHLEPVTLAENKRRGQSPAELNRAKTHCPDGHPYDEANTYLVAWKPGFYGRQCRTCSIRRSRERTAQRQKKVPA